MQTQAKCGVGYDLLRLSEAGQEESGSRRSIACCSALRQPSYNRSDKPQHLLFDRGPSLVKIKGFDANTVAVQLIRLVEFDPGRGVQKDAFCSSICFGAACKIAQVGAELVQMR